MIRMIQAQPIFNPSLGWSLRLLRGLHAEWRSSEQNGPNNIDQKHRQHLRLRPQCLVRAPGGTAVWNLWRSGAGFCAGLASRAQLHLPPSGGGVSRVHADRRRSLAHVYATKYVCSGVIDHTNWRQMKLVGQVWNDLRKVYMKVQQACPKHAPKYSFYYSFGTMLVRMLVVF